MGQLQQASVTSESADVHCQPVICRLRDPQTHPGDSDRGVVADVGRHALRKQAGVLVDHPYLGAVPGTGQPHLSDASERASRQAIVAPS